jgi:hypothetical protein
LFPFPYYAVIITQFKNKSTFLFVLAIKKSPN